MELETLHDTREGWLSDALTLITPRIEAAGYSLPAKIKVACGFPMGSRGGKRVLAQTIAPEASADGITEMFISPTVSDPVTALGCVLVAAGHSLPKGKFKAYCSAMGIEGKKAVARPGANAEAWLRDEVLPQLGAYPHAAVDPNQRKKQSTRMIKLVCPETGYTVRTTAKWIKEGFPTSPAGHVMVIDGDEASED